MIRLNFCNTVINNNNGYRLNTKPENSSIMKFFGVIYRINFGLISLFTLRDSQSLKVKDEKLVYQ